jgi:hypothetical protein
MCSINDSIQASVVDPLPPNFFSMFLRAPIPTNIKETAALELLIRVSPRRFKCYSANALDDSLEFISASIQGTRLLLQQNFYRLLI